MKRDSGKKKRESFWYKGKKKKTVAIITAHFFIAKEKKGINYCYDYVRFVLCNSLGKIDRNDNEYISGGAFCKKTSDIIERKKFAYLSFLFIFLSPLNRFVFN